MFSVLAGGCATTPASDSRAAAVTDEPALCALCDKPIPAGAGVTAVVDNKTVQYRCIHCALTDSQNVDRDIEIRAVSPISGEAISLQRTSGTWTSKPAGAVYLILPERADECLDLPQPFVSIDEFNRYVGLHPEIAAEHPQPFSITQYEQILKAGQPK